MGDSRPPLSSKLHASRSQLRPPVGEMPHALREDVSLQVVLTTSQIIWCRDLTECLETDEDRLEAMEAFEKLNFEVRFLTEWH